MLILRNLSKTKVAESEIKQFLTYFYKLYSTWLKFYAIYENVSKLVKNASNIFSWNLKFEY
jgi:hypothetical protein